MGTLAAPAPRHRVSLRPHAGFITASALFAAVLVTLLLSAFHAPSPHGLPVGIVAPAALTGHVEQALGSALPGGFDLRLYGGAAAARTAIAHSQLDGALIAGPGGLRLLVAQAAGTAPTQALTNAFGAVAAGAKLPLTVTDVVPPLPGDSQALSPFFVILAALFPSLAAGSASALVFRRARPAWCVAAPVVAAIVIGAVTAGIADGVAGLGNYPVIAGIIALFALAVAAPTAALVRIWPPLAALALLVFMAFSLPASGGPAGLASFAPGFLRVLHPALPLGAAASAVRGAVYFDGYGTAGPLWVLAAWALAGVAALTLVAAWRRRALVPAAPVALAGAARPPVMDTPGPVTPAGAVVGFDNSEPAQRALRHAARLVAARHGTLHVVYADHMIVDSDLSGFGHAEMEAARDQEAAETAKAAADIVAEAGIPYTFERRHDTAADAILAAATAVAAAPDGNPVIVVGRSGHAARHLLGSVPTRLLHHSPYPVLTIP
jgi:nucleotide-binding universal stress UspA family protein